MFLVYIGGFFDVFGRERVSGIVIVVFEVVLRGKGGGYFVYESSGFVWVICLRRDSRVF